METVVVTGAAGFIGSHVCEALLRCGQSVVGVDNFDPFYAEALKRRNVAACEATARGAGGGGAARFELVEADICDHARMRALMTHVCPAGVIHLAAKAGVRPSIADPVGYARVNVVGTSVVLEAAREAGCGRFVMASSSSVYGNNEKVPFGEEDDVSRPISPYAATKLACELIAHAHQYLTGMPTACMRFFTVYGARQRPDLAIGKFMGLIAGGEEVPMFGDGSSSRDYTYIDDIVAGVLAAYDAVPRHGYRVWNLGGSRPVSLGEMIEVIAGVVGKPARVKRMPGQAGDVERTYADVTRSRGELGFEAKVGFEEGVRRQWEWMRGEDSVAI